MYGFFIIVITLVFLIFFHEIGHIISAKLLKLSILRMGFRMRPYPSFVVQIQWPSKIKRSLIFLFAGNFVTILLLIVAYFTSLLANKYIYMAFAFQLITETNPFYSDYMTAILMSRSRKLKQSTAIDSNLYANYAYTAKWYLHFILWALLIFVLLKYK